MFIKISFSIKNTFWLMSCLWLIKWRHDEWNILKWSNHQMNHLFSVWYSVKIIKFQNIILIKIIKSKYWCFFQISWNVFINDESSKVKNLRWRVVLKSYELFFSLKILSWIKLNKQQFITLNALKLW
jgi:hypothetical protein